MSRKVKTVFYAQPGPVDPVAAKVVRKVNYAAMRQKLGSKVHVASVLGVSVRTLIRREQGTLPISDEAWIAMKLTLRATLIGEM